jgi:hypothetical protein
MFPTGAAGVALVLLRLSVSALLVANVVLSEDPILHMWELTGLGLLGVSLCLGVFTPVASILTCLIEITALSDLKQLGVTHFIVSILIAASLAMLGPGAYSVDARMFGRRLVVSSTNDSMDND